MRKEQVFHTYVLILAWLSQTCSSVTDLPILECGPEIEVPCKFIDEEPVPTASHWTPAFCYHRDDINTEIRFMYSKPPLNFRQLEIKIWMDEQIMEYREVNNTQTRCRYKNLKPGIYRIYIRAIMLKSGENRMTSDPRVEDIPLFADHTDTNTVKKNTTITEMTLLRTTIPQENIVTETIADKSTTYVTQTVSNKHTFTDSHTTTKDTALTGSGDFSTTTVAPNDPAESLIIVLLIIMVAVVGILLAGVYWRQHIQRSISRRDDLKTCSNLIPDHLRDTSNTSSEVNECQDTSTSACDGSYVFFRKHQENDQKAYDSGFDSTMDWTESSTSTYKQTVLKLDENSTNNCDSLCDISDGNFVANPLVWADMDRDLSQSVCTISSLACDTKRMQLSTRRGDYIGYSNQRHAGESLHIAQVDQDIEGQSCTYKYIYQDKDETYNGKTKQNYSALSKRHSSTKVPPNKTMDLQNESSIRERARLLGTIEDNGKCDNFPIFLSLSHVQSAETLNLSLSEEMEYINNFSNHLTPGTDTHCYGNFNGTKHPVCIIDEDKNDMISLGEISV